ncbi:hydroxyisourate hydrolase [Fictibacillus sp. Mic-4]|uniref:hydroxyisourate hydrolase n=1 Tax=Fictibacillus TaxID=1329200 RepID=UPI0004218236|nr:hydroxyisourate hydrolase [Fictibacillus gelatini]
MNGRLTTHVLDLMNGIPAKELKVELWQLKEKDIRTLIRTTHTNSDGRVDSPLLSGDELETGEYELVFYVGDYFERQGVQLSNPPFLNKVPLRFGISDPEAHYHVPLLVAPGGYSTYRGS